MYMQSLGLQPLPSKCKFLTIYTFFTSDYQVTGQATGGADTGL